MRKQFISFLIALVLAACPAILVQGQGKVVYIPAKPSYYTGLVAYWRLDEASGTRVNSMRDSTFDLSATGTPGNSTGKIGSAVSLNGTTQVLTGPSSGLPDATSDFTACGWVYLNNKSATQTWLSRRNSSSLLGDFTLIYEQGPDRFRFYVLGTGVAQFVSADTLGSPSATAWYFICGGRSGSNLFLEVNAGTRESAALGITPGSTGSALRIGAQQSPPAFHWNGLIDAVGIWTRALGTDETTALYNSGNGIELFR